MDLAAPGPLLELCDLSVSFGGGAVHAVDGVDLELHPGEVLALVGESGSGKSVCAQTVLGLTRGPGTRHTGAIRFDGIDLLSASETQLRAVRGKEVAMVFQDPMTSLNPLQRVGAQVEEVLELHTSLGRREVRARALALLEEVGIADAAVRGRRFPHEFSGGMRQRVMIAMALACEPRVLIADEPTTALDVTIQAQVLDLLLGLRERHGTAILLITHDLGVVAETADRVAVMYGGRIVETAGVRELFADPRHPYTWGLLGSVPRADGPPTGPLRPIAGAPPRPGELPSGCRYRPRCPAAHARCEERPPLAPEADASRAHACWLEPGQRAEHRAAVLAPVPA